VNFDPGAYILILMELPAEEERRTTKLTKSQDVEDAVTYLRNIFWIYANDDRYNLGPNEYREKVTSVQ
jgi:hypothetical protein